MAQFSFRQWLQKTRESRILILIVVTVALFVDCIINTVIAPILPTLLIGKNTSNSSVVSNYTSTLLPDNSSKGIYQLQNANGTQDGECYTKGKENSDGQEFWIGLLLAFKGMLQMVANPIVGVLTNRFGYDAPLLVGFAVVFFSTLMYAFGEQYVFLCVARGLQGIGSSLTIIPVGAPFGSLMNGSFGKSSPFYVLAAVTLLDGALRLCILRPSKFSPGSIPATPYLTLLADPYILVTVVGYFLTKLHSSLLQAIVPIRMMEHMCAPSYQLGLAFVPAMLTTILTLNGFAILSLKWGRWLCLMLGFIIQGIGIICFPLAANIFGLIGPSIVLGIGTALVGASIMPLMAYLIDLRHTSVYGGIYAITDAAFCLGFAIGPLFGGAIASAIGFTWVMVILCVLLIIYAPLFILLRNVSGKDEKKPILNQENTPEEAKSDDQ
uniref:Chromaffin granule amine transporter n=1 Tax=Xenopus tropicalis TaxID=8364 RepID=A0A6I8Q824_XENTR